MTYFKRIGLGLMLLMAACQPFAPSSVIVPQSDGSPPAISLAISQEGIQSLSVSSGGAEQSMTLVSKTAPLAVVVTASDAESGIQAVEVWISKRSSIYDANGNCLLPAPEERKAFESVVAKKNTGETTSTSSLMLQSMNLVQEIQVNPAPGETITVAITIYAIAVNHAGVHTQTPNLVAIWQEP